MITEKGKVYWAMFPSTSHSFNAENEWPACSTLSIYPSIHIYIYNSNSRLHRKRGGGAQRWWCTLIYCKLRRHERWTSRRWLGSTWFSRGPEWQADSHHYCCCCCCRGLSCTNPFLPKFVSLLLGKFVYNESVQLRCARQQVVGAHTCYALPSHCNGA